METLADPVCLRMACLCFGVFNIVQCHVELVVMLLDPAAVLSASISENTQHRQFV